MTQRVPINDLTSEQLAALYDDLDTQTAKAADLDAAFKRQRTHIQRLRIRLAETEKARRKLRSALVRIQQFAQELKPADALRLLRILDDALPAEPADDGTRQEGQQ